MKGGVESIRVAVRVRPYMKNELGRGNVVFIDPNIETKIKVGKDNNYYEGAYDRVFGFYARQIEIYEFVRPLINDVLDGINCTVLTYGQTGSGKTFTMFGADWTHNERESISNLSNISGVQTSLNPIDFINKGKDFILDVFSEDNGVIPRIITNLFNEIDSRNDKINVYCSFLQIYNEKIYDLLKEEDFSKDIKEHPLNIREDKISGIYVEGLTEYIVENVFDCVSLLKRGEKFRKTSQTRKNEMSSRSHTIFILIFESGKVHKNGTLKRSKLHLCDLAGSEKYDKQDNHKSIHFSEMVNINLSLVTLGKVINALSQKQGHTPYRDSKLTRLLQDSLGGNTKTCFITTISPAIENYDETLSTLKFADRAKSVFSKIQPNEILAVDQGLIKKLTDEINNLKQILALRKRRGNFGEVENQFIKLKEENEKLKQNFLNSEDIDKLMYENRVLKLELQKLKSKNDFYIDTKLFDPNNQIKTSTIAEISQSKQELQNISSEGDTRNIENNQNYNIHKYSESSISISAGIDKLNSPNNISNLSESKNNIFSPVNQDQDNKNLKDSKMKKFDFLTNQTNENKNINEILNNLIINNNNSDLISENSSKKNLNSYKDNSETNLSNKKTSLNSSLFKAGESLISGQFSSLNKSLGMDKKNRSPDIVALKQVNDRLRYLEKLEKESTKNLNKQREKIKIEKIKKEEEMKKKIEDKKRDLERIENHIKKLDYLYKDPNNANIYSNYLLEKVNKEKDKEKLNLNFLSSNEDL